MERPVRRAVWQCNWRSTSERPRLLEQRKSLFELFEVLAHGAIFAPDMSLKERGRRSQTRMVGGTKNRASWGLHSGVDPTRSEPEAEPLLLKRKSQLEKNNVSQLQLSEAVIQKIGRLIWPTRAGKQGRE
jgi:hypothetical protein